MQKPIQLAQITLGAKYLVSGFNANSTDYIEKLHRMGFVEGTPLELAPVKINDPMVVLIRGSRIALRKHEAKMVLVEENN